MLLNKFYTTSFYETNIAGAANYDLFPYKESVADIVTIDNVLDDGKMAVVNINISFDYLGDDFLTEADSGETLMTVWIVGKNSLGEVVKESCLANIMTKNAKVDMYKFANAQNYYFKIFLKAGQKVGIELTPIALDNNISIHCAGKITDFLLQ